MNITDLGRRGSSGTDPLLADTALLHLRIVVGPGAAAELIFEAAGLRTAA